ncbi:MAG: hypothetical protein ABSH44_24825 [Bryobacteraceae bacterium]|jgi:hypothetical protein
MRTTILLSSLLFLAGYATAQDSPITVGDTGPIIIGGHGKQGPTRKAATSGSTYVGHSQFQYDGPNNIHHVSDQDHEAACFTVDPAPTGFTPVPLSGKKWVLTLNDKKEVELRSTNTPSRIEIDVKQRHAIIHSPAAGKLSLEVDYPLTSAVLAVTDVTTNITTTTPYTPKGTPKYFIIHYCQVKGTGLDCTDPTTKADPCNPTLRK